MLELGCGLGLGSICAARAGATRAHATDIEENALRFASANAAANGVADAVSVGRLDWSAPRDHEDCYDVVLAADVVYDETAPKLLAELLPKLVSAGGVLLLADNADRPYGEERRAELMRLCADAFARCARHGRVGLSSTRGKETRLRLCYARWNGVLIGDEFFSNCTRRKTTFLALSPLEPRRKLAAAR